ALRHLTNQPSSFPAWRPSTGRPSRAPPSLRAMPHHITRRTLLLLTIAACAGSTNHSDKISEQVEASGNKRIDLKAAVPTDWDRVCVVGPYQDAAFVEKTLGFAWPAERKTSTEDNDGISLLLFAKGQSVVAHVEYPRN